MKRIVIAAILMSMSGIAQAGAFKVESRAYADGMVKPAQFADVFGCSGGNLSPDISWSGAPAGTRSFVVSIYDKDAPTGSGFWHWEVIDIPAQATSLAEGVGTDAKKLPKGARMTRNDAGQAGFLGACPPPGQTHDYRITVKALKVETLPVPDDASGALVGFVSNANTLAEASIVARGGN